MSHEIRILNLLYRYAELIDSGDLDGAARLFRHAKVTVLGRTGPTQVDEGGLLSIWKRTIRLYDDGTPRTKHVITNPIVEVDVEGAVATCRSYYSVLQQVDDFPLQVVAAGRYLDDLELVDGVWRYSHRDYTLFDLQGDLSRHLLFNPA